MDKFQRSHKSNKTFLSTNKPVKLIQNKTIDGLHYLFSVVRVCVSVMWANERKWGRKTFSRQRIHTDAKSIPIDYTEMGNSCEKPSQANIMFPGQRSVPT